MEQKLIELHFTPSNVKLISGYRIMYNTMRVVCNLIDKTTMPNYERDYNSLLVKNPIAEYFSDAVLRLFSFFYIIFP